MKTPIFSFLCVVCCVSAQAQAIIGPGGGLFDGGYIFDPEINEIQYIPPTDGGAESVLYYGTQRKSNGLTRQKILVKHDITHGVLYKYDSGSMMPGGLVPITTPEGIDATQILSPETALSVASSIQPVVTSYSEGVIRSSSVPGYSGYTGTLDGYIPVPATSFIPPELELDVSHLFFDLANLLGRFLLVLLSIIFGVWVVFRVVRFVRM